MSTGSDEIQLFVIGSVNQQPVRLDMALSAWAPVSGKAVVTVLWRERSRDTKCINNLLEQSHVIAAFYAELKVFFEFCGRIQIKHRLFLREHCKKVIGRTGEMFSGIGIYHLLYFVHSVNGFLVRYFIRKSGAL